MAGMSINSGFRLKQPRQINRILDSAGSFVYLVVYLVGNGVVGAGWDTFSAGITPAWFDHKWLAWIDVK
jgi:hypothetical protein